MSSITELNREHWDSASSTYATKFSTTIDQLIGEIQARLDWIGVDWLDSSSSSSPSSAASSPEPETSASAPATSKTEEKSKREVRLLDYACGTGMVSRALAPSVTSCVGIDLTPGMVTVYNSLASNQGLSPSEMHAYVGDLVSPSSPPPSQFDGKDFHDFDIAVVGLGFHHFEDPGLAAKRLGERLRVGGALMIVDFMPHGDHEHTSQHTHGHAHHSHHSHAHSHSHAQGEGEHGKGKAEEDGKGVEGTASKDAAHTVTHHGFSSSEIQSIFEAAGCGQGFDYVVVGKGIVFRKAGKDGVEEEMKRSVFMARGVKV